MKTKLIFATETSDTEKWAELPFIPRLSEWINTVDILEKDEIVQIWKSARCWSGIHGTVQSVEYRRDNNGFYSEIFVWCED